MTDPPELNISIAHLGGNCPVQGEGTINGAPFYFRARGRSWRLEVGEDANCEPLWYHREWWGDGKYAAGWMPLDTAREMIAKAAALWLAYCRNCGLKPVDFISQDAGSTPSDAEEPRHVEGHTPAPADHDPAGGSGAGGPAS